MNWRRWPWLEQGALPLAVLSLRLIWLWPWLLILGRWTLPPQMRPFLPLWLVAALMFGGALTARFLPVDLERPRRARLWAAGLGFTAILLTLWWRVGRTDYALWDVRWVADQAVILTHWNGIIPLSVAVLGLAAYLWLLGMQHSVTPNHDDIWQAFAVGFVALVLLLIAGRVDPAGPPPAIARWIVLFFAVGMAALALAGLRMARGTRNTSAPLPANRYWVVSIASLVVVLLAVGSILALLITPDGVARTMGWVGRVVGWIALILGYVFYGIVYVLFLVLTPLIYWLEENVGSWLQFDTERLQNMQQGIMEQADQPAAATMPAAIDESLRWIVLLVAILIVAAAFASALQMLRKRNADTEDEVRETILTQSLLRDQASALWQRWRDRLLRDSPAVIEPFLPLDGEYTTRRRVRAAYQAFLAAMLVRDAERPRGQSPIRYAQTARTIVPTQARAVDSLTDRYIAARYSGTDPAVQDALDAEAALSAIRDEIDAIEE